MENIQVNMEDILSARFGKDLNKIDATFKKTVKIKEYETEVLELHGEVNIEPDATGIERMLAATLLGANLEYTAYTTLATNGNVSEREFHTRRANIEKNVNMVINKYIALTGENPVEKFSIKQEK